MREGRRVLSVGYAESVGRYIEDFRPDLVLLDLYLNGRSIRGQEFCSLWRASNLVYCNLQRLPNEGEE